jgi:hypothetical protein
VLQALVVGGVEEHLRRYLPPRVAVVHHLVAGGAQAGAGWGSGACRGGGLIHRTHQTHHDSPVQQHHHPTSTKHNQSLQHIHPTQQRGPASPPSLAAGSRGHAAPG